ncbi:MAG: MerR family transcriptional regulator [Desulfobulbus sp.]|uniref:MerR family transcriptional regulator n=1 Tax=Desulfobulbus sp. TaxID=895 RepID=UPI002844B0E2|nr:MerR family transcriptional regulator [Desulfobulbus sp.]MDR2549170.1 MerR family transcriptional regulator [Desulfobulbus sp.]
MKEPPPEFPQIPDKIYFRIGEVSHLVGVDTHVLRYWESEFSLIKPFRGPSKQRLYRRQDVHNLLRIKKLLHDEGYTISGARRHLKQLGLEQHAGGAGNAANATGRIVDGSLLIRIKQELREILAQLDTTKKSDL